MRLMTDCDVITHSIVKQSWHITTKGEAAENIQHTEFEILYQEKVSAGSIIVSYFQEYNTKF